ncbi:Glutaminyl-peptide cyclotransferase [Platanthera guangdongensis]|uniref:Glutaminyl-peptide cyclotransferase n=1 Tax=Platanthera guangdongensis TaxID=2320717 RepID=A0ABR2M0E1_9ASPA
MPARFERKEKLKQPSSRLNSSMVSPSPTRPKALPFSLHRGYIGRRTSIPCALVALGLVFVIFLTWKHAGSQETNPSFYSFDIVNEFPHGPQAFTQGTILLYISLMLKLESSSTGNHTDYAGMQDA